MVAHTTQMPTWSPDRPFSRVMAVLSGIILGTVTGSALGAAAGLLLAMGSASAAPSSEGWGSYALFATFPLVGGGIGLLAGSILGGTGALGWMNQRRWWPVVLGIGWPAVGLVTPIAWPLTAPGLLVSIRECYGRRVTSGAVWLLLGALLGLVATGIVGTVCGALAGRTYYPSWPGPKIVPLPPLRAAYQWGQIFLVANGWFSAMFGAVAGLFVRRVLARSREAQVRHG